MATARPNREGYFVAGDGLRGLAALMVLGFHGFVGVAVFVPAGQNVDWGAIGDLFVRLNAGLYVFFVISGYLVGGPWVRAWLRGSAFPRPRSYLARRARRIVPAFWVVTAGLLLWFGASGASAGDVLVLLAFGQVFLEGPVAAVLPHGWTLDVEVMFYLALPVVAGMVVRVGGVPAEAATRRRALLALLGLLFVGGLLLRRGPAEGLEQPGARTIATFVWAFVPGLLLAAWEPAARARLAGSREGRALALALGALGLVSVAALAAFGLDDGRLSTLLAYAGCGGGLVGGALVWQWTTGRAPAGFDTRVAHALGRWSYGIYLVHVGVGRELVTRVPAGLGPGGALAFVLGGMLVVSVALAALLWWLVEEPAITGRRPRLPGERPPAAAVETPTGPAAVSASPEPVSAPAK